jgi:hypothetical protein
MGQYQQWLLTQEIDRRLKSEVESLETELLYLKDRISILEQTVPETENVILQALLAHLQSQVKEELPVADEREQAVELEQPENKVEELPAWNGLPKLETPSVPVAASATYFPGLPPQTGLASTDMLAFFEEHRPTDPRLAGWRPLEKQQNAEKDADEPQVDAETQRLNESIQRWFERWHRQMADKSRTEEVKNEQ